MANIQITGIRKANGDHESLYEAVSHYRWVQHGTDNAGITDRPTVVGWVDRGTEAYVSGGRTRAYCFVNQSSRGTRFLQTRPDATAEDNLLYLPEC
jgi:hypothetical protein